MPNITKAAPAAWMTHHDAPMIFPTREEAEAHCDDDEEPLPLFEQSPAAQEEDALRYRWLRDKGEYFTYDGPARETPWAVIGINHTDCHPCSGERLDEAIDRARASNSEGKE